MPPNTAVCRLCLSVDVRVTKISGTPLQLAFENLTKIALHNAGRPITACYICYAQLSKCYKMMLKAAEVENILAELLKKYSKITVRTLSGIHYKATSVCQLSISTPEILDNLPAVKTFHDVPELKIKVADVCLEPEVLMISDDEQCDPKSDLTSKMKFEEKPTGSLSPSARDIDYEWCSDKKSIPHQSNVVMKDIKKVDKLDEEDITASCNEERSPNREVADDDRCDEDDDETPTQQRDMVMNTGDEIECDDEGSPNREVADDDRCDEDDEETPTQQRDTVMNTGNEIECDDEGGVSQHSESEEWLPSEKSRRKCTKKRHQSRSDTERVQCHVCLKSLSTRNVLNKHLETHFKGKTHKCDICDKLFGSKSNLHRHKQLHISGDNRYKCVLCKSSVFTSIKCLKRHIALLHNNKKYVCAICQRKFCTEGALSRHFANNHKRKAKCNLCLKWFRGLEDLNVHLKTHDGEKKYECDICHRPFKQRINMRRHKLTHTGEKPYQCYICQYGFVRKDHLNNHLRTHIRDITGVISGKIQRVALK